MISTNLACGTTYLTLHLGGSTGILNGDCWSGNYGETWTFVWWIDDAAVGVLPVTVPLIPVAVLITGGSMELTLCCVLVALHRCFGFSLFRSVVWFWYLWLLFLLELYLAEVWYFILSFLFELLFPVGDSGWFCVLSWLTLRRFKRRLLYYCEGCWGFGAGEHTILIKY